MGYNLLKLLENHMRTVISKKIDDHEVIIGFDRPVVDPVATKKVVIDILEKDGDLKKIFDLSEALRVKIDEYHKNFYSRKPNMAKIALIQIQIQELEKKYIAKLQGVENKRRKLEKENPAYFEPKSGEYIISESICKKIEQIQIDENHVKCLKKIEDDFDVYMINDFRGKKFFEKTSNGWKEHLITKLDSNVPLNAKELKDLSESEMKEYQEQMDLRRIRSMSLIKREQERDRKIEQYLRLAAIKKTELEIKGELNVLEKSQEYFEQKKAELIERYK